MPVNNGITEGKTMINNNKVVISGIDTSKLPVLSDEQKEKLLIRIKQFETCFINSTALCRQGREYG